MAAVLLVGQGLFLGVFLVRIFIGQRNPMSDEAPRAQAERTAPRAWALLVVHGIGISLVAWGITRTFNRQHAHFPVRMLSVVGFGFLLAASALAVWALRVFTSWRLLARIDPGHALCTDGPYRFVRHPIYLATDLWAVGSTLTCPASVTVAGMVIVLLGSDLRARTEEALLAEIFGQAYRDYRARVRRFIPGVY